MCYFISVHTTIECVQCNPQKIHRQTERPPLCATYRLSVPFLLANSCNESRFTLKIEKKNMHLKLFKHCILCRLPIEPPKPNHFVASFYPFGIHEYHMVLRNCFRNCQWTYIYMQYREETKRKPLIRLLKVLFHYFFLCPKQNLW